MGQPYNIVTAVRLRGDLTSDRLQSALDKAQQRHPLLKVNTILDSRGIPWFTSEGIGAIPLTVIDREDDDHALRITEKELNAQFDMDKPRKSRLPLMRVTLLRPKDTSTEPSDVILCAQHAIADGMSMAFLVRDLLQFMTNPKQAVNVLDITASTQDIFPPEVRKRIPKSYAEAMASFKLMIPPDVRERIPKSDAELIASLKPMKSARVAKLGDASALKPKIAASSSKIHTWQLAADQTQAFLTRCKQEQVTVQSALCTAFLTIFTAVNTPVNVRRRLALPVGEAFGVFASGAVIRMKYDAKQGFWDNARQFHSKLQQELKDPFAIYTQFSKDVPVKTMQEFVKLLAGLMTDQRPFAITNLGSLDKIGILLQMGDLRVESFFGVISPGILAEAIALIVYTINGIMHFHIHYMEPATTTEEVKKFTSKAMSLLESAIEQTSPKKTKEKRNEFQST
jgi:hypothetical protein